MLLVALVPPDSVLRGFVPLVLGFLRAIFITFGECELTTTFNTLWSIVNPEIDKKVIKQRQNLYY
ncbi:MAG: hypothetical protein QNJ36_07875 [Calothrix sp. MO_167.B42]|nr:hypothetical protein [Calothrix sp. MO_167.B42]